ncbi:tripartite tricarboxylate transporter substrate binding protein [Roseiarcaceae bacterium H3SJ34-1]|uniref:Bug family tripartite tricarboxylate transporter substrate binding protein n=1 Tax=Terripilifer ovatus TaxID=3032367 RepID=UPI003AB92813|nr:tripartite tricarboxylate transporter substrate binding protein [Roseiarcaceae bacterium H3SJ34-1]
MASLSRRTFLAGTATAALASGNSFPRPAIAQTYPSQDIRFVTGTAAGSGGDVIVRYLADRIRQKTGKTIIVDNRVGGGGNIAIEYVARAKPDGYTILIWSGSYIGGMMSLLKQPPIDVAQTLDVVATVNRQAFMVVVDAKTPYRTLDDLTKAMLAKGDKASYATSNFEATVIGEIYKARTGVKALEISYRTAADSMNDIYSGTVDYAVHNPVLALAQQREGKLRILGVGAKDRFKAAPDIPTMTEQGIPMNVTSWWSATVPAGTAGPIVEQINKWFVDVVSTDETRQFLSNLGTDPFISTPKEAQALMLEEIGNWRDYVKLAKLTPLG